MRGHIVTFVWGTIVAFLLWGCGSERISIARPFALPAEKSVAVYALKNYTVTPQAGKKAANLIAALLRNKGYRVVERVDSAASEGTQAQKRTDAARVGARYLIDGAVNEWRYKTGIDGEPAVSLTVRLVDTATHQTLWSGAASQSSYGTDSLGVVAQNLVEKLFESDNR